MTATSQSPADLETVRTLERRRINATGANDVTALEQSHEAGRRKTMSEVLAKIEGADFSKGVALASLRDGEMLKGHVGGEPALVVTRGGEVFAIAAAMQKTGTKQLSMATSKSAFRRNGEKLAVAVLHCDLAGLQAEAEFEKRIAGQSSNRDNASHSPVPEAVGP